MIDISEISSEINFVQDKDGNIIAPERFKMKKNMFYFVELKNIKTDCNRFIPCLEENYTPIIGINSKENITIQIHTLKETIFERNDIIFFYK